MGSWASVTPPGTVGYSHLFTFPSAQLDGKLCRGRHLASALLQLTCHAFTWDTTVTYRKDLKALGSLDMAERLSGESSTAAVYFAELAVNHQGALGAVWAQRG